jgi:heme-degrading monooxygenase HmoA
VIIRTWRGRTLPESAAAYEKHVTDTVFPRLKQLEGYIGGRVLRRDLGREVEFMVMTEWATRDAIRAFAGDTPDVAVVEPAARRVLTAYDRHVEHFEVAYEARR